MCIRDRVLVLVVVIVAVVATEKIRNRHGLSPLRARIVSIAQSQVGYKTDPADTYCLSLIHIFRQRCWFVRGGHGQCA